MTKDLRPAAESAVLRSCEALFHVLVLERHQQMSTHFRQASNNRPKRDSTQVQLGQPVSHLQSVGARGIDLLSQVMVTPRLGGKVNRLDLEGLLLL